MAETLKGGDAEWLERPDDGLSPEQRKEKGQMEFVAEGILKEVEEQEMRQAFEAMGQPKDATVEQVRENTDFQEAPKVKATLEEIRAAAEAYARENDASFLEGLEQQLADYEGQIEQTENTTAREGLVEKAAWNSVLLDSIKDLQGKQAEPGPNALPDDVL